MMLKSFPGYLKAFGSSLSVRFYGKQSSFFLPPWLPFSFMYKLIFSVGRSCLQDQGVPQISSWLVVHPWLNGFVLKRWILAIIMSSDFASKAVMLVLVGKLGTNFAMHGRSVFFFTSVE